MVLFPDLFRWQRFPAVDYVSRLKEVDELGRGENGYGRLLEVASVAGDDEVDARAMCGIGDKIILVVAVLVLIGSEAIGGRGVGDGKELQQVSKGPPGISRFHELSCREQVANRGCRTCGKPKLEVSQQGNVDSGESSFKVVGEQLKSVYESLGTAVLLEKMLAPIFAPVMALRCDGGLKGVRCRT